MTPIFSLDGIEMRYGPHLALQIDRLEFQPGRAYSLVGPNGAGKSTLLQLLALLARPARGSLTFAGQTVRWKAAALRALRNRVTLVHQTPYLFDRSIHGNLAFGLGLRGIRGRDQERRVDAALEAVGMAGSGWRPARELSGGEAQRVAIARALALHPEVLLLDEPTANLYRDAVPQLEELLLSLMERGTTVIFATHDPGQPQRLGSEVVRLAAGRLVADLPRIAPNVNPAFPMRIRHAHV